MAKRCIICNIHCSPFQGQGVWVDESPNRTTISTSSIVYCSIECMDKIRDIYYGSWTDFNYGLHFVDFLMRLFSRKENKDVYMC